MSPSDLLSSADASFALENASPAAPGWPRSFTGDAPRLLLTARGRRIEVRDREHGYSTFDADPFDALRRLLDEQRGRRGAAVGYLGYGLRHHIEALPPGPPDDLGLPDIALGFYDEAGLLPEACLAPPRAAPRSEVSSNFSRAEYEAAVRRILDYIVAGDIYQANLSQRFSVTGIDDGLSVYERLRRVSPAPFGAYLRFPGFEVVSSSPERFISYRPADRLIETRPIKGTRPRDEDAHCDRELAAELLASEKDRAENLMIVDLERNDLGRVAVVGSVEAPSLFDLESFATVHHLTSTVQARLRPDRDAIDLLRAMFPCGSVTGAPKIRAMEVIDELETVGRGPYTGAIGYIGFDGSIELSVAIRVVIVKDGRAHFHVGGGIVADSDPTAEYRETLDKARGMARALGVEL